MKSRAKWGYWLREKFKKHFLFSFKSTILSLYLPIIIVSILITGMAAYLLAAAQVEENEYRSVKNTVAQTENYLDKRLADALQQLVALSNHPDILAIVNKDSKEITPEDYIRVQGHVENILLMYNVLIDSIYVNFHNGEFNFSRTDNGSARRKVLFKDYRDKYHGNSYDIYWQAEYAGDTPDKKKRVASLFKLFGRENAKSNGIILFELRYDFLEKVLNTSFLSKNGYLMLVSPDGELTFKNIDSRYQLSNDMVKEIAESADAEGQLESKAPNGDKVAVIYSTMPTNRWKLVAVFPVEEIYNRVKYIKYITIGVSVVLLLFTVGLANALANYIARPISSLTDSMKRVQGEDMDFISDSHPLNELGVLNQGVEDLVKRVKILLGQIKEEQENKRQLEFSVMQTQIRPHFLYNTLYSIKGLCDMGLTQDASAMLTALSNFFRISISRGAEIISVEQEVEHIRNYLFIQEMRYGDDFSYQIEVDENILSYNILKLTLQPLVENAIYHGVKQKRGDGCIRIIGCLKDGFLHFTVQDNGLGMTPERLAEICRNLQNREYTEGKMGLGIRSVQERLKLYYGDKAGIQVLSQYQEGTTIEVVIPSEKAEDTQNV